MPNPTGTVYLTAAPGYVWTDGDVYEIAQTDQQEGAAIGASFSGLGVDNQPHQVLLNKIQLVHNKQLTDEATITSVQNFCFDFVGLMGSSGYLKIPVFDVSRGLIEYVIQWGAYLPGGGVTGDHDYGVTWPAPFPNAALWAGAMMAYSGTKDLGVGLKVVANVPQLSTTGATFFVNLFNVNGTEPGFYWLAIGY